MASSIMLSFFDQFPEWNGIKFQFRNTDGYANVTPLNAALGKRFSDWRRTKFATELLDELSKIYSLPVDAKAGGTRKLVGGQKPLVDYNDGDYAMYIHPAVALSYCTSHPRLQARVNAWVINMMTMGTTSPHHKDWTVAEYLQGLEYNREDADELYGGWR